MQNTPENSMAKRSIDDCVEEFLQRINFLTRPGAFYKYRKKPALFSGIGLASDEFYRMKYFEEHAEPIIREFLINPILKSLLSIHGIKAHGTGRTRNEMELMSTERLEDNRICEFCIDTTRGKVGYRYTGISDKDDEFIFVLQNRGIRQIEIIRWSFDHDESWREKSAALIPEELRHLVSYVSPKDFFASHLTMDEYQYFEKTVTGAIIQANAMIDFEVIPRLSGRHLSEIKTRLLAEFAQKEEEALADRRDSEESTAALPEEDENAIDRIYYGGGLYRALLGTSDFAECFLTAEYLFEILGNGGHFDHTVIACGYFKSVEQLTRRLVQIALHEIKPEGLWIKTFKTEGVDKKDLKDEKTKSGITIQKIRFIEDYESRFDKSQGTQLHLLHDHKNGWRVSDDAGWSIFRYLNEYNKTHRNEYFHGDNIDLKTEQDPIEKIRSIRARTLEAFRLLLGGYILPGGVSDQLSSLGWSENDYHFGRLYEEVTNIPRGQRFFLFDYDGAPTIKALRHFDQEPTRYDESGEIISSIKFSEVNDFNRAECDEGSSASSPDRTIALSKNNYPKRVRLQLRDGTIKETYRVSPESSM